MSRRITQRYRCPPLRELARQLLFAPPEKRAEQVRRLERLHDETDPEIAYPFEYLSYRITGYRSESEHASPLPGADVLPDLRLLIDGLSHSVDMPGDEAPAETAGELSGRLDVSTKTIQRWRDLGLRWRWAVPAGGGRKRVIYPRAAVDRFLAANAHRVERAARFSHVEPAVRARLIDRARRIAQMRDVSLNQVATHLARRTGRAVETVRLLLAEHDREHPGDRIFASRTAPLTVKQRRVIARAHRMGVPLTRIARHFGRTRSTIYRAINERRAAAARRLRIAYVASPMFTRDDANEVILRPEPAGPTEPPEHPGAPGAAGAGGEREAAPPGGGDGSALAQAGLDELPGEVRPLFGAAPLPPDRQLSLLVRLNYLRFKADRIRNALDRFEPRVRDLDEIDRCLAAAADIQRRLVRAGLRVLLSVARRHLVSQADRSASHLVELLDLGQGVLQAAIEEFDPSRGQAFDAYLTWSLMRRFASHQIDRAKGHQARRRTDVQSLVEHLRQATGGQGGA